MCILLNSEAKEARRKFSNLKPSEKESRKHDHYVNMIALLSTRAPKNVPGFNESATDFRAEIREFFSGDNAAKGIVISEAIEEYFLISKRKSFYSGD